MNKKKITRLIRILAVIVIVFSFSGCLKKDDTKSPYKINLEVWGLFENDEPYRDIFTEFVKRNPGVGKITYKKMVADSYQKELIDALASGQGPDIFLIHNNWVPSFKDKMYPALKEIVTEQQVRSEFVDVVADDFVMGGDVYALPLSVDSLGLYYNKDLFNAEGITAPPTNWDEFVDSARKLTKFDQQSQIIQSGAAMGTANNINRSVDVVSLLMLQNNTPMVNDNGSKALFATHSNAAGESFAPGENAWNFYTRFASRSSQEIPYTWNQKMHYSIDAFSEGNVGMMLNYSWQREILESKSPKLNYAVAPVPQFSGEQPVNFANYWGYAVAKNRIPDTKGMNPTVAARVTNDLRAKEAWRLLSYMATKKGPQFAIAPSAKQAGEEFDPAKSYLEKTRKPAARKDLIELQKTDARYGVFAMGNLIAKNWYQVDPDAVDALFAKMITQINDGEIEISEALKTAELAVSRMMSKE